MGEYAIRKSDNQRVKIGTCESMYYIRYEDRHKVRKEAHSLDPASCLNLFWRLPFPDESHLQPGDYDDYNRGLRLYRAVKSETTRPDYHEDYSNESLADNPGAIQLHHENSGLLVNVPCHHGERLPDIQGAKAFFNGKGHSYELAHVKNTETGLLPIIRCRHCRNMWRMAWADIWEYLTLEWQAVMAQYRDDKQEAA